MPVSKRTELRFANAMAVISGLMWVVACTDEPLTFRGSLCRAPGCAPGCETLEIEPCDVEQRACQERVFQSVRCVHGGALQTLPVTTSKSRDQFSEEVKDRIMEERDPDWLLERDYIDRSLRLLGLLADDRTGAEESATVQSSAAAVFSSEDESVTVVQMGPQWVAMKTLAHEYVHAQQQASYPDGIMGLYAQAPPTQAGSQAVQAFIEGEAVLYEWLTFAFMRRTPIDVWGVEAYFELTLQDYRRAAAGADSPWYPSRAWLHYPIGALYLLDVYRRGGHEAVQRVRRQIPPHFVYWVQGYPPDASVLRERALGLGCSEPELVPGFKWIAADELGPSAVFAIAAGRLREGRLATEAAWQLAQSLRGDSLAIFAQLRSGTPAPMRQLFGVPSSLGGPLELTPHLRAWQVNGVSGSEGEFPADASTSSDASAGSFEGVDAAAADAGADGGAVDREASELQPEGQVLVAWRLSFSDASSAKQFEAVAEGLQLRRVLRDGAELLLMGSDQTLPSSWSQRPCR